MAKLIGPNFNQQQVEERQKDTNQMGLSRQR